MKENYWKDGRDLGRLHGEDCITAKMQHGASSPMKCPSGRGLYLPNHNFLQRVPEAPGNYDGEQLYEMQSLTKRLRLPANVDVLHLHADKSDRWRRTPTKAQLQSLQKKISATTLKSWHHYNCISNSTLIDSTLQTLLLYITLPSLKLFT